MVVPCDGPARYCNGDEVCSDTMDLVIAYECSNSVTQLGCWFMASFVVSLMERMPASSYGFATLKLGLVKFGNGMSLPDESNPGTYYVQDAVALSPLTFDHASISGQLYGDAMKLWTVGNSAASIGQESRGGETWQLGYNNLGQALKKSQEILDASDRVEGDVVAIQKVIVLTKGKRAQCTIAREVATTMKEKGIFIDVILFSADYETNTKPYEILHDVASFPYQEHVTVIPGLHTLSSWHSRYQNVVKLIPSICPKAVSPTHAIRKQCAMKALKLHQGRTCGDWTEKLSDKPVKLEDCVNAAIEGGYKSFVFTDTNHPKYEGEKEANCFTNKKDGKLEAFDPATFKPLESNCKYKADYDKDNKDAGGWLKQDLASGNGELTAHYAVLESKSACPKPWDYRYKKQIFSDTFQPEAYVVKK